MGPELVGSGKQNHRRRMENPQRASMGPELVGSGKQKLIGTSGLIILASMGPELVGSGKLLELKVRPRRSVCFNGAGAGWLRKTQKFHR